MTKWGHWDIVDRNEYCKHRPGRRLNIKTVFPGTRIPIIKIRRSWHGLDKTTLYWYRPQTSEMRVRAIPDIISQNKKTLQCCHNERGGVPNHQPHDFFSTVYSSADQTKGDCNKGSSLHCQDKFRNTFAISIFLNADIYFHWEQIIQ